VGVATHFPMSQIVPVGHSKSLLHVLDVLTQILPSHCCPAEHLQSVEQVPQFSLASHIPSPQRGICTHCPVDLLQVVFAAQSSSLKHPLWGVAIKQPLFQIKIAQSEQKINN
jgi:hypothetical protein